MQTLMVNVKPRVLKTTIKALDWYNDAPKLFKFLPDSYHEYVNDTVTQSIRSLWPELKKIEKADDEYMESFEIKNGSIVLSMCDTSTGQPTREVLLTE